MSLNKIYINKNIKLYIIIYIILHVLLSSCSELFFGEEEQSKEFSPGKFRAASVSGTFNIVLIQDSTNMVVVRGPVSTDHIKSECINDTLRIKDNNKFPLEPGKNTLELHITKLDYLVTYGPVCVTTADTLRGDRISWDGIGEIAEGRLVIDCNSFVLFNSANTLGNIKLSGKTRELFIYNRYGSSVFADSLICRYADITNESAGDVYVNASEKITAYIWGPGNIYYYGDPVTELKESKGSGRLIRIR